MRKRLFLCLALCVALASCANVASDYKPDPASGEGVIVGSITYDSGLGEYSLLLIAPASAAGKPFRSPKVGYSMAPPLGPLYDDGLKARGGTYAVAVPAGEYRIVGWQLRQGYKITRSTRATDMQFTVEAGKASYLGNLHFSEELEVSLRERSQRDIPVLESRYAFLKTAPLAFTMATGTDLQNFGGDAAWRIVPPPPNFIFVPVKR